MITETVYLFSADNGRVSILRTDDEQAMIVKKLETSIARMKVQADGATEPMAKYWALNEVEKMKIDLDPQAEYQVKLSDWRKRAEDRVYLLKVPGYTQYEKWEDESRITDEKGRPTATYDMGKLGKLTLPNCVWVPDDNTVENARKLTPAEVGALEPFLFEHLWDVLYLGIRPSLSILPTTARRS